LIWAFPYAAGSLYSTVDDLYLWDQALYTNQLFSPKSMDLLFTGCMLLEETKAMDMVGLSV
jgi:hypothetical protein